MAEMTPKQAREWYDKNNKVFFITIILIALGVCIFLGLELYGNTLSDGAKAWWMLVCIMLAFPFILTSPYRITGLLRMRVFCPHCDKHIHEDIRWRCGHCDCENGDGLGGAFINRCRKCKRRPSAYVCHHCDTSITFESEGEFRHAARAIQKPIVEAKDEREQKHTDHLSKKEELLRKIEITELERRLAAVMESPEFKRAKTSEESLREKFTEYDAHVMGIHMLKYEVQAEIEKIKDPVLREQKMESLNAFVDQNIPT
jgi:hypothetical protein